MPAVKSRVISIKINSAKDEVEISKDVADQSSQLESIAQEFTNFEDPPEEESRCPTATEPGAEKKSSSQSNDSQLTEKDVFSRNQMHRVFTQ